MRIMYGSVTDKLGRVEMASNSLVWTTRAVVLVKLSVKLYERQAVVVLMQLFEAILRLVIQ